MKITFLGCGSSAGVPVIGCRCDICTSKDPKNIRTRASIHVEVDNTSIIIDTGPEFRTQVIRENITSLDSVIITHAHADHLHGIDDTRAFALMKQLPVPVYSDASTVKVINTRFPYLTNSTSGENRWMNTDTIVLRSIEPYKEFHINDVKILPFIQQHGMISSLGIRIGSMAYSTDFNDLSDHTCSYLSDLELWILDCSGFVSTASHLSLEEALQWVDRIKPKKALLTHMNHRFDYSSLCDMLPEHIRPAYDGLVISLS